MGSTSPPPHERAAALLRRQRSTTARLRSGLPQLLDQLDQLDEPQLADVEAFPLGVGVGDRHAEPVDPDDEDPPG